MKLKVYQWSFVIAIEMFNFLCAISWFAVRVHFIDIETINRKWNKGYWGGCREFEVLWKLERGGGRWWQRTSIHRVTMNNLNGYLFVTYLTGSEERRIDVFIGGSRYFWRGGGGHSLAWLFLIPIGSKGDAAIIQMTENDFLLIGECTPVACQLYSSVTYHLYPNLVSGIGLKKRRRFMV